MTTDPTGTGAIPQEAVEVEIPSEAIDVMYATYRGSDLDGRAVLREMLAAALPILTADLAAARQQLDAVRALCQRWIDNDTSDNDSILSSVFGDAGRYVLAALAVAPTDAPATKDGQE